VSHFTPAFCAVGVLAALSATTGCGLVGNPLGGGGSSSGENVASSLSPSSSTVSFGGVAVGSPATESVVLTDAGSSNVTISSISIAGANFSVKSGAAVTLTPNQTTTISVAFAPTATGSAQGTLSVASDASNSKMNIMLTGTGIAPSSQLSPSSTTLNFGNATVGGAASLPVVLTDHGTADLTISSVTVQGTGFSASGGTNVNLNPDGTATINVKFDPTHTGSASGTVTVASNAANSPVQISLSGTGVTAPTSQLSSSTTSVAFGNVTVGSPVTKSITLTDAGTANVSISTVSATGTGFSTIGGANANLNPNGTATVSVTFSPTAAGVVQGKLSISSNATNSVVQISLSATGVAKNNSSAESEPSQLTPSATSVGFGSVNVGTPVTKTVNLTDSGSTNITISGVSTTGAAFSASGGSKVTLTPNGSVAISVSFDPTSAAAAQGTLSISSNASNTVLSIPLSGTGTAVPAVQHSVALNWQPSASQITGYFVYRGASASSTSRLFVTAIAATTYTDSSVANGQTYFYAVTSVDSNNVESAPSNQISVTIP
jgi:Abnormal spindle-like microcephaly-assoc'd, ASPM-SPD-2-Hydin